MIKGQQFLIGETCIQIVCRSDLWYSLIFQFDFRTWGFHSIMVSYPVWVWGTLNCRLPGRVSCGSSLIQSLHEQHEPNTEKHASISILKHSKICPTLVGKAFHFPLILPQNTNRKHVVVVASTWSNIRLYYWNQATNETTWIRPGAPMGAPMMPLNPGFQPFFYPQ